MATNGTQQFQIPPEMRALAEKSVEQAKQAIEGFLSAGHRTVSVLEDLVAKREATPSSLRCDNGPELISEALRDWCRFNRVQTAYIEPGAPWQNPYVESFNGHLRRELLELETFNSLFEAQVLIEDWRLEYNHYRPHQSLAYQTPAEFTRRWQAAHSDNTS